MPVTLNIVDHHAPAWTKSKSSSAEALSRGVALRQHQQYKRLVQTSFAGFQFQDGHITPSANGFVWAAFYAYSSHHHLCIHPEDVWFAILTQISFYINANAEKLRSLFVAHDGQKELETVSDVADFAFLAVQMSNIIGKNVLDPGLKDWVLPAFSTTTPSDRMVGSVLFMGAMQKYFSYNMIMSCGLPSVTLLGCVEDWEDILSRLDKLDLFGDEPRHFASMLRPILRHMVLSFADPSSTEVPNFWNTMVHQNFMGSGNNYLSGWLTAFCFWDEDGKAKSALHPFLKGATYPTVKIDEVPAGFASVPVQVNDYGYEYKATMISGSVGILATASSIPGNLDQAQYTVKISTETTMPGESAGMGGNGTNLEADKGKDDVSAGERSDTVSFAQGPRQEEQVRDTVQAFTGWWIFEN